ncbi:MAG: hypothetical protein U0946_07030, partial [Patescibacteria group bacterium]|nr:hypothetical protein [Patescibacteria group bacterium]
YFDGHDSQSHLVRLYEYDQAVKDGQLPPRWAGGLLGGRGYPVFIFAYPLPYALAEAFHLMGFSLAVSIKLTFVLGYLTSIISMYYLAYRYWQSRLAGFLSALLWSWVPYIFVMIFVSGLLGTIVSYIFIPLAFLGLYQLIKAPGLRSSLCLSLILAGWVQSHMLTPIIFSPLLIIFSLIHLSGSKKLFKAVKYLFLSLVLTLILSSAYLIPAMTEIKYTHFNEFVQSQYASFFIPLTRLIYSPWGTGIPGETGMTPMSQQVGIAQWLVICLALIFFCHQLFKKNITPEIKKVLPFLIGFILSIFLMLQQSEGVWRLIKPLQNVGFPSRFLSLAVFSAAMCGGYIVKQIGKNKLLQFIIVGLLITLTLYGNRNHIRINEKVVYTQEFFDQYIGVATGWNEHLPIWIKENFDKRPTEKIEIINGDCQIISQVIKSNLQAFTLNCQADSTLQLNSAYYPGWQLKLDNQNNTQTVKNYLPISKGMMRFDVRQGQHILEAKFTDTPVRYITKLISLTGLIIIMIYWLK